MDYLKPALGIIALILVTAMFPIMSLFFAHVALFLTLPERPNKKQVLYFTVVVVSALNLVF